MTFRAWFWNVYCSWGRVSGLCSRALNVLICLVSAHLKSKYLVAQWFYPGSGSICHGITYYKVPFSLDSFELPLYRVYLKLNIFHYIFHGDI